MRFAITFTFLLIFIFLLVLSIDPKETYDFCYMCQYPNTYVRVIGKDSDSKRKKARELYGCTVYARIEHCSTTTDSDGVTTIYGPMR